MISILTNPVKSDGHEGTTPKGGRLGRRLYSTIVPASLLGAMFIFLALFIAFQSDAYGRTYDEELQDEYGKATLAWYMSGGQDESFLKFDVALQMPQHGPFFEVVVAAAQAVTDERWTTRAVITGLAALFGVAAIALCGYELGGWWVALVSATGLVLYPRYFGAMFNNPKDVPFAAAMIFVLWLTLRMIRRWSNNRAFLLDSSLVGFAIGMATSIRVLAIVWYGLLALLLLGWWVRHGSAARAQRTWPIQLGRQVIATALVGLVSLLTMCALWPYIFLSPIPHLLDSISSMSKYPWNGMIPLGDEVYHSQHLPRRYTLEWLAIGSPPTTVLFGVVGGLLALVQLLKIRTGDARVILVGLYFCVPVLVFVALRPTMYNGLRQFLFLAPGLMLLAAYGFVALISNFNKRGQHLVASALVIGTLAAQGHVIKTMVDIHPYEYVYFSPVVGGVPGAVGRYELDYWGSCSMRAARWLAQNYGTYIQKPSGDMVLVDSVHPRFRVMTYLPDNVFREVVKDADFYVWSMREGAQDQYPSYVIIHEEKLQGYAMCSVKMRPTT